MRRSTNTSSKSSKNNGVIYSFFGLLLFLSLSILPITATAQFTEQIGQDVIGIGERGELGDVVKFSGDGTTYITVEYIEDENNDVGVVSVYQQQSGAWVLMGSAINTEDVDGEIVTLAISDDGQTIAIGNAHDSTDQEREGTVKVYAFTGGDWVQQGNILRGNNIYDHFGISIDFSADATYLVVGAHRPKEETDDPDNIRARAGYVETYKKGNSGWSQVGSQLLSGLNVDTFGMTVKLSGDASRLFVSNWANAVSNANTVYTYKNDNDTWSGTGFLDGSGGLHGFDIATSFNGEILAIASYSSSSTGAVDVYKLRTDALGNPEWTAMGSRLEGASGEGFGNSIDLTPAGYTLFVGASNYQNETTDEVGAVKVYNFNGGEWVMQDLQITGQMDGDVLGHAVSASSDGLILAIGAPGVDANGMDRVGLVRVLADCPAGVTCTTQEVAVCGDSYDFSNGTSATTDGRYDIFETPTERVSYLVTFQSTEQGVDVFQNATIAQSGSVTYQANTNATGVLSFDKTQDFWVNLNALQDDLDGKSRSVFMWVKAENNTTTNQALFAVNAANGDNLSFIWIDPSSDNLEVNRGGSTNESASYNMGGNVWHYVGWTYDHNSGETVTYVDGIENDRFTTRTSVPNVTAQYSLGQEFDGNSISDLYNGEMAEISVWDEVLTGADIRQAMKARINNGHPKYNNLVGYYSVFGDCDDATDVLKDHSGKGNDGVMVNDFTVDFQNVQSIPGFNAIDWYENISWKKDGSEVSTAPVYTFDVAAGSYEFIATRSFIQSSDSWTLTTNTNATTVDLIADETLCEDDPITRTVSTSAVNYLDFEEGEFNRVDISNSLSKDLEGKSYSAFMWLNKESSIGSGNFDEILVFQDADVSNMSRFYIRSSEQLALWDGVNNSIFTAGTTALANDTWYFVGYTYDQTTGQTKVYVNGIEDGTGVLDLSLSASWFATIGAKLNDNGYEQEMDGKLAEITIWDKVLTQEEIADIMATAPAHNSPNLVAAYGTLPGIADNRLRDLTSNGHDGLISHPETMVITTEEVELTDYNALANSTFSWKKGEAEFGTDATGNITVEEGVTAYSVTYGTPLFQKSDEFSLSYTNLLPMQPVGKTVVASTNVTLEVEEIRGASYQWYKREEGFDDVNITGELLLRDIYRSPDGTIYSATSTAGIYYTTDEGNTWVIRNTAHGLLIDDIKEIKIFDDNIYAVQVNKAVSISKDGGNSFQTLFQVTPNASANLPQTVMKAEDGTIYIGALNGLHVSTDGGANFSKHSDVTGMVEVLYEVEGTLYVGSREGLFISNDNGATFIQKTITDGLAFNSIRDVYKSGNTLYVSTQTADFKDGAISISTDAGESFTKTITEANGFNGHLVNAIYEFAGQLFVGTSRGLFVSSDQGDSFSRFPSSDPFTKAVKSLNEYNGQLEVGTLVGLSIYKSNLRLEDQNGGSTNLIEGATTHQLTISNVTLEQNGNIYFVEVIKDGCKSQSDDVLLTVLDVPGITSVTPADGTTDIAIDTELSIEFSRPVSKGTGELKIINYATDALVQTFTADDLTIDGTTVSIASGVSLEYATQYYITLDADLVKGGNNIGNLAYADKDTWSFHTICEDLVLGQPEAQSAFAGGSITFSVPEVAGASYQWFKKEYKYSTIDAADIGFDHGIAFSGYAEGSNYYMRGHQSKSFYTSDYGETWIDISTNRSGSSIYADGNQVYQGGTDGIALSYDGGKTFKEIKKDENGLEGGNGSLWEVVFGKEDRVYAYYNDGFFVSTDRGESFAKKTITADGIQAVAVTQIREYDGAMYLTAYNGLYISKDGGDTFTRKTTANGLSSDYVSNIIKYNNLLFLVSTSGTGASAVDSIELSYDNGESFTSLSESTLGSTDIRNVSIGPDGKLYIATPEGLKISNSEGSYDLLSTANGLSSNDVKNVQVGSDGTIYAFTSEGLTVIESSIGMEGSSDLTVQNAISGATTASLTISNLTEDLDQTEYFVVVTKGDCVEISDLATLTLSTCPPLITSQPTDQAGLEGTSVTFSIPEIAGADYQWNRIVNEANPEAINTSTGANLPRDFLQSSYAADGNLLVGTSEGLGILRADASEWEIVSTTTSESFPNDDVEDVFYHNGNIYAATNRGGVAILREGTTDWEIVDRYTGNGFPNLGSNNATTFVSVVDGDLYVGTFSYGLMILKEGSSQWEQHNTRSGSATTNFPNNIINDVFVQDEVIYVATHGGLAILRPESSEWEVHNVDSGNNYPNNLTSSVFIDEETIYAGTSGGLAILRADESAWEVHNTSNGNGFPNNNANKGALYVYNGTVYYAGGGAGLGILRPEAMQWEVINSTSENPLPNNTIKKMSFSDGVLYLATGNGIGSIQLSESIENNANADANDQMTGADSNSLTINNITTDTDQSEYFVIVTKGDCEERSETVMLNVTEPLPALDISSTSPSATEDAEIERNNLFIYFDEEIVAGEGTLTVYRASDDSEFGSVTAEDMSIANAVTTPWVRATFANNWEASTEYYVQLSAGFIKNAAGTKLIEAIDDKTTFTFTGESFAENIITRFFPSAGSNTYAADSEEDLVLYTSENVGISRDPIGAFRIYKASNDELVKTIEFGGENDRDLDYGDGEPQIRFEFEEGELEPGTEYYVLLDDGFIVTEERARYHVGISDANSWRFTTLSLPSTPILTNTSPATVATDVSITANITLTYSENVQTYVYGEGGDAANNVVLYDANDNIVETFAANTLSFSGSKVTINPTSDLAYNTAYYVLIDNEAFISNNGVKTEAVTDPTTISFTTAGQPNTAPVATNVTLSGNLEANQQLTGNYDYSDVDTDAESGSTLQWFVADDASGANRTAISGATASTFTLTSSEVGKFITFGVTPNDGSDAGSQAFATYAGPVVAAVVPTIVSTVPADGAIDLAKDANLSFVLSESVTKGTGNITLTPVTGTATVIDVTSAEVTVSGTNVSIDPSTDLLEGQFYTVTFDAAAFVDADGNNSAGLTSQSAWNFTVKEANVAPVAQGVSIKKSLVVDGVLEGSYTYSDANDDPESGTTFQWYRADNSAGANRVAIAGATTKSYTVVNDDNGKYVSFEVTPSDGTLTGTAEESTFFGSIVINDGFTNIAPAFTSDAVTTVMDNETYTYTVTYEDLNNDVPILSIEVGPIWLTANGFVLSGNPSSADVGEHSVQLELADQFDDKTYQEFTITVLASNTAPSVNGVEVSGTTTIDEVLTATYNFIDAESDADNSSFKWYRSDDNSGTGKTEIAGANTINYVLTAADAGKYISFEVTPNDGKVNGTAIESVAVGPITKKRPSLSLSAIAKTYGDADFDLLATTNSSGAITYTLNNDQTGAAINGSTVTLGNVGEITVNVNLAEDAEYAARQVQGTITVGKKAIELTATNLSKEVGDSDPTLQFTVTNGSIVGSDEVVTVSRDAGEAPGTYAINLTYGADATNYEITAVPGVFTISQRSLTITAQAATKTYGDADPAFNYSFTQGALQNGDELSGAITRINGEDVGSYALESSLFNPNYNISFVSADLTIEKADLIATADDQTKYLREANPELTITYSGFVNGDSKANITEPTIATTANESSPVGTYAITLSGGAASNYNLNLVNGTLAVEQKPFITTWEITSRDVNRSRTLFNTLGNHTYLYDIDWGDGTVETNQTGAASHTYVAEGTYTVKVSGQFPQFELSFSRLRSVEQWGDIEWKSMEGAFIAADFDINATDAPNLTQVTSMKRMFERTFVGNPDLTSWDVSTVTDMSEMFKESDFNGNISGWNVSAVTDMSYMFAQAEKFNSSISNWNTSAVQDMSYMFSYAQSFDQPIDAWDVSSVTSMSSMFADASLFNQDLNSWNVSNVTTMEKMFDNAELFNGNITGWDVSSVTDMSNMFDDAKVFNQDIDGWDVSNVTEMNAMFNDADGFNQDLNSWNVSKVETFQAMFQNNDTFNGYISNWDVSNATKLERMFEDAHSFNRDIGNWQPTNAENLTAMFRDARSFNQDIGSWRFPNADRLNQMFYEAAAFNQDISTWETGNIVDMSSMFENAESFNQNIGNWDVSSVTSFGSMFRGTRAFNQDISGWDMSAATGINSMFKNAAVFNQDISGWTFSADLSSMSSVFENATAFNQNLSSWDVTNIDGMYAIFSNTGMSVTSYDATLIGWAAQEVKDDVEFGVEGLQYCAGASARQSLIDNFNWTIENDSQSCTATVTIADVSANEDDGAITVALTSDAFVVGGFTVDVSTADGTAIAGTDYTAVTSQTITFAGTVGETQTFTITPTADSDVEGNETLTISMSNLVTGADNTVTITDEATITILNDDVPVVSFNTTAQSNAESLTNSSIVVNLDQAGLSAATVDYTVTGTATGGGVDYTLANGTVSFAAGDLSKTIDLTIVDDALIEENETVVITLSNASGASLGTNTVYTYTIVNNDAQVTIEDVSQLEDGESFLVTATLEGTIEGGFTVDLLTADGTATVADGDYTAVSGATLTFSGTDGEVQKLDIAPGVDSKLEADETFTVSLSNLAGTTANVVITDQAILTIKNDDAAAVTLAEASGNEGGGAITITATLDNAVQGGFTVEVNTADGTATLADSDYTAVVGKTLTFAGTAGETQTFTVTPINDLVIEANETLTVSMSNMSRSLAVDISDEATVTIVNDDFNNAPTDITLSESSIAENNTLNAAIGTLTTADADAGNTHTYALVSGAGDTDNASFTVAGSTLKANNTSFNFEDKASYSVRIETNDGEGGTFVKAFEITVTNVNEAPFTLSLTNATIEEADDAQEVGLLMSLDPDNGDIFTYSLVAGAGDDDNAQFAISGNTLSTAGAIDFEDGASRSIRVQVADAGGLTFEQTFSITIEDVVAEPVREYTQNQPGADVKNVFSPNGDGVNETWVIEDLLDNPFNQVKIFAQGGKLIYSKVNYSNDWAGTFKENPVPDGTYYYEILIYADAQSTTPARTIKGFLTIIRNR